ncbi:hypothetical protein GPLA_3754 [Paraglaciecola polaris LMG 21857]|uniref:Uncharacterized protein n=1 Tax=Paraglaciecola polaris LMG 21857 TaxID=1129793 RepID=K6YPI4_9ALTE|nr:hypothetical protein GPLA_3754 [Paraglaciecola polaris LMG 21857]
MPASQGTFALSIRSHQNRFILDGRECTRLLSFLRLSLTFLSSTV